MCGVAGIVSSARPIEKQRVAKGISCIKHRGPDQENIWVNEERTVCLGHQRLSIIDLSERASQPLRYLNRYTIIHNGEIYNYREVRETLEKLGCAFQSESDTEVAVAAYSVFGVDCLQQFEGMFAFCIWDEEEKMFFAARDRFGEKPFYFYKEAGELVFASEIKALWQMGIGKEVNQALLYNFLTIGYTSNPSDPSETFYNNISKLPAASYLVYDQKTDELQVDQYWQLDAELNTTIKDSEAIERFQELMTSSVQLRLRSDVPVGTSLSGGLDSSTIVALCNEAVSTNYSHHCFTAVFPGFEKDESLFARKVASRFDLKIHKVTIDDGEVVGLMDKVSSQQDEPISSASALIQYKVFEAARSQGIKVLLDGQGADEILAGYHKYYHWYWQELYRKNALGKSRELSAARAIGVKENFAIKNKLAAVLPEFAAAMQQSIRNRKAFQDSDLNRDFAFAHKRDLYYSLPTEHTLNGVLYFNTVVLGLEELLRLADRNSMSHGVEVRLPFLNHELVKFSFSLPSHFKIRNGWTKWILRESIKNKLLEEIVWRRDKTGFEPPQKKWMQLAAIQQAILSAKEKLVADKILSPSVLKKSSPHSAYDSNSKDWRIWSVGKSIFA